MSGLFVKVTYTGGWYGEDPITETVHETPGALFRSLSGRDKSRPWEALGRCTGRVYVDIPGRATERQHIGWVFVARNPEPTNRGDTQPTGLREAWVTVHDAPDTVTRTEHYADLSR
jgi:hypothetical protein